MTMIYLSVYINIWAHKNSVNEVNHWTIIYTGDLLLLMKSGIEFGVTNDNRMVH